MKLRYYPETDSLYIDLADKDSAESIQMSENVIFKLRLLVASSARLQFLNGDASVGLSLLMAQLKTRASNDASAAYVPPGGSSPLTVLGHVEALMELAETHVAVGDQRAHVDLLGKRQRVAVMSLGFAHGAKTGGDVGEQTDGPRLAAALTALLGERPAAL